MASMSLNVNEWSQEQFGACELGDRRRTARLLRYAAQAAADPSSSTPRQTECWDDCKAAYRLIENEAVTFAAVTAPHYQATRADRWNLAADQRYHRNAFSRKACSRFGPHGQWQRARVSAPFLVDGPPGRPGDRGLGGTGDSLSSAGQTRTRRGERVRRKDRESVIWSQVVDQIGSAPEGVRFLHVFDRGGDQFELYCRMARNDTGWVVRACQLTRHILAPEPADQTGRLPRGTSRGGDVHVELAGESASDGAHGGDGGAFRAADHPPAQAHQQMGQGVRHRGNHDVGGGDAQIHPPQGTKAARWVLLCSDVVRSFETAWQMLEHYEKRWLIEEFHKALKSGCRLEERQYEAAKRLEAVAGVLSVVAVRLLQLKTIARDEPQRPAKQVVPTRWIQMLQSLRKRPPKAPWTVRDFYRELAKLGGFLGRKSDGEPGWMTLWRGFEKLHLCLRGADAYAQKCG